MRNFFRNKNKTKLLCALFSLLMVFSFIGCSDESYDLAYDIAYDLLESVNENGISYVEDYNSTNNSYNNYETSGEYTPNVVINGRTIEWYSGKPYIEINNNEPFFTNKEITTDEFEIYEELDSLGRCGVTFANISPYTMPTEERGEIGHIKPSGWHSSNYRETNVEIDGNYLYNRCHLIGFQLAGENDNRQNLITGTRYLNIDGMLGFENMIADYVKETGNHVMYRVTPIFDGNNLLASGVLMEAYSVEDNGAGICFNVFAYNVQPGVEIDYATGDNWEYKGNTNNIQTPQYTENKDGIVYILNTNSKKYHYEDCPNASSIKEENKETFNGTIDWLEDNGYSPCGSCKPN